MLIDKTRARCGKSLLWYSVGVPIADTQLLPLGEDRRVLWWLNEAGLAATSGEDACQEKEPERALCVSSGHFQREPPL